MAKKSKFFEPLASQVAGGLSIRSAAATCNCSETHAYHLSSSAEFKTRVNEIRSEIAASTVGTLTMAASEAASTLRELLGVANEPNTRLNAAKAVLANLAGVTELGELRKRLDALEKASKL